MVSAAGMLGLCAGGAFGYAVVGTVVYRLLGALFNADNFETAMMAALWPMTVTTAAVMAAVVGTVWLAWHTTELPAALVCRLAENRKLRAAERVRRLQEADRILSQHGLDFKP